MSTSYIPFLPDQQYLMSCALQERLPQGHLAYFISDTVDNLSLSAFHVRYAGGGSRNQPFHPSMMVEVVVYAYATGVFSSRKISRKLHEDVGFRVLAAENFPAHRTIRDFRALHQAEFTQLVHLAREIGLFRLGTIAVDGTKIKANTSRHKAMSNGRMQTAEAELKAQIVAPRTRMADTRMADPNPASLTSATSVYRQPRHRTVSRTRVPDLKRTGGGFDYSYNAQTGVDEAAHSIVAAEVVNTSSDVQQLLMVLVALKTHTGSNAGQVLAELAQSQPQMELVIALGREGQAQAKPTDAKRYPLTVAMQAKFETAQGKADYRRRKWIAEPPNGWIKNVLEFRQFSMRGLQKAQAEFKLVCLALNLRRMGAMQMG